MRLNCIILLYRNCKLHIKVFKNYTFMKIELELFDDCSGFELDMEATDPVLLWQLKVNDVEVGSLNYYKDIVAQIDTVLDIEEKQELIFNK